MPDHITIGVSDLDRSATFYDLALAPLGIVSLMEATPEQSGGYSGIGYGATDNPFFWIGAIEVHGGFQFKQSFEPPLSRPGPVAIDLRQNRRLG